MTAFGTSDVPSIVLRLRSKPLGMFASFAMPPARSKPSTSTCCKPWAPAVLPRPTLNTYAAKREDLLSIATNLSSVVGSGKGEDPGQPLLRVEGHRKSHEDLEARKTTGSTDSLAREGGGEP